MKSKPISPLDVLTRSGPSSSSSSWCLWFLYDRELIIVWVGVLEEEQLRRLEDELTALTGALLQSKLEWLCLMSMWWPPLEETDTSPPSPDCWKQLQEPLLEWKRLLFNEAFNEYMLKIKHGLYRTPPLTILVDLSLNGTTNV